MGGPVEAALAAAHKASLQRYSILPRSPVSAEAALKAREASSMPKPLGKWEKPTQCVVIIRHGKTEHNKLGLFTGWEDVALAREGRAEAREAGRMMARAGIQFDVVTLPHVEIARAQMLARYSALTWCHRCTLHGFRERSRQPGWLW